MNFLKLTAISVLLAASLGWANAALVSGTVDRVVGDAKLIVPGGQATKIATGMSIPTGSQLETGANGKISVVWMDGATSIISPNSALSVVSLDLSQKDGAPDRKVVLDLTSGSIFSNLTHGKDQGVAEFRIKTPKGDAVAQGTQWKVEVRADGTVEVSSTQDTVTVTTLKMRVIKVHAGFYCILSDDAQPLALTLDQIVDIASAFDASGFEVYGATPGGGGDVGAGGGAGGANGGGGGSFGGGGIGLNAPIAEAPVNSSSYSPPVSAASQ